jgi:deazaflavin-dependent oxidoreductase (nitroreductase family)
VPGSGLKYRVVRPLEKSVVNPLVNLAWRLGIPPPGDALLETTGRRTGKLRRTPVCDGLDGETFWLISQHGRRSEWMQNIEADPRVRITVRNGLRIDWRNGTAHILDDDDPHARIRTLSRGNLARSLCVRTSRAMGTSLLTVRIDLDPR